MDDELISKFDELTDSEVSTLVELALRLGKEADQGLIEFQTSASEESMRVAKSLVGRVLGEIYREVLRPVHLSRPQLLPPDLFEDPDG